MPSIEIPLADFRVEYTVDFDWANDAEDQDVTFRLMFGRHKIVEKAYTIPQYDYEDYAFNDRRDDFDEYVAERLGRLFS